MARKFRRREILILGSTAAGSILLKACTPNAPTATAPSASGSPSPASAGASPAATGEGINVGLLHSLSGTMAISEKSVVDAEQLAIEEINKAGGVLGKQIIPIVEDGKSDWPTFNEKAKKLIDQDKVATVFGCWTSSSRKAVLETFETKSTCCGIQFNTRVKSVLRMSFTLVQPPTNKLSLR
jgi:urea transport system substrate-binding protein